jgi:HAD superfamily hydrolase (TIGR01484 family)
MSFRPLTQEFAPQSIRLLATDMDGTLTQQGKFTANLLQSLERLKKANLPVLIVTGRSAGWVEAIKTYLPVYGAIAENGGLFYRSDDENFDLLATIADANQHRQQLAQTFQALKTYYPELQESSDNRFRFTDWTFDVARLSDRQLQHLASLCSERGFSFTYSTVQCHIKPANCDKASSLIKVLNRYFPHISREQILTVGDSPNDESLFDRDRFGICVGVANILHYRDRLKYQPAYVTAASEGEGFCEVAELVLSATQISK